MAKRNFDSEFKDLDGQPVVEKGKTILLKTVIINALLSHLGEDSELSGSQRIGLFSLAQRVQDGGEREYTIEELATIDKRVLKTATTLAYARVNAEIERESQVEAAPTS